MKAKFKRLAVLGLAGVMCATLFTACGQQEEKPTEPDTQESTQETSEEKTETETETTTSPVETETTAEEETTAETIMGKWSVNNASGGIAVGVFDETKTIFAEATKSEKVEYEPLALIGTQDTEDGTNYKVLCYANSGDSTNLIYLTISDSDDEETKASIIEKEELDLEEMETTVNSMGTPRDADSGYTIFENGVKSDLAGLKELFTEYTSASSATCYYTPKAVLGVKNQEDGTTDYAILCTRTLFSKTKSDKVDYGIAFLHVGATRADTFMKQVHLLDLSTMA